MWGLQVNATESPTAAPHRLLLSRCSSIPSLSPWPLCSHSVVTQIMKVSTAMVAHVPTCAPTVLLTCSDHEGLHCDGRPRQLHGPPGDTTWSPHHPITNPSPPHHGPHACMNPSGVGGTLPPPLICWSLLLCTAAPHSNPILGICRQCPANGPWRGQC